MLVHNYTERKMNRLNYAFVISIAFAFITISAKAQTDLTCQTTDECLTFIENSVCEDGFCNCPDGQILSSDRTRCLLQAEDLDSPCEENVQCSARLSTGGICSDNQCVCADGFHYLKGICWKSAGLNDLCYQKEQCYGDYEYIGFNCVDNKCQCRDGFYERYSGCRRIMHEDEPCSIDSDCQCENGEAPKCSTKCKCGNKKLEVVFEEYDEIENEEEVFEENGEMENEEISKENCQPGTFGDNCTNYELGMECNDTTHCDVTAGANSSCYEDTCSCITASKSYGPRLISQMFVASRNNRRCQRPLSDITGNCQENAQCVVFGSNAICEDSHCKCTDASHWLEKELYCWPTTKLGDQCTSEKDCYAKSGLAECTGSPSICSCQQGYHPRDDDCFVDATHVGDTCAADEDCVFDNSKCDNATTKECICEDHYYESDKLCIAALSSTCENDQQCNHIENAFCNKDGQYCDCEIGFISSENQELCLPVANYSGKCVETVQCSEELGELKQCRDGLCLCNETAHYYDGKCYETKRLEEKCSNKIECVDGKDLDSIVCLNGKCACQYDYARNSENKCVKDGGNNSGKAEFSVLLTLSMTFFLVVKNIQNQA